MLKVGMWISISMATGRCCVRGTGSNTRLMHMGEILSLTKLMSGLGPLFPTTTQERLRKLSIVDEL